MAWAHKNENRCVLIKSNVVIEYCLVKWYMLDRFQLFMENTFAGKKIPLAEIHNLTRPALMSSPVKVVFHQGRLSLRSSFKVMSSVPEENVKLS